MRKLAVATVGIAVLVFAWLFWPRTVPDDAGGEGPRRREAASAPAAAPRLPDREGAAPRREVPPAPGGETDEFTLGQSPELSWAGVDLDAVRAAMPDNLYWKMSSPTQDEAVQAERQAERDRWNVEYGKVLSGTGTEEEVRAYYDHRARLFGDYVEFVSYLLDHYRSTLPERDVGMLELARKLSLARLEEIPRKVEEALQRKHAQDEAREAWLADQKAFADLPAPDDAAPDTEERTTP